MNEFSDLDLTLTKHPINNDITNLKNFQSINAALKNIILTTRGKKLFNPFFGVDMDSRLFDPIDILSSDEIIKDIKEEIGKWEPRIELKQIDVYEITDNNNALDIDIIYIYNNSTYTTNIQIL